MKPHNRRKKKLRVVRFDPKPKTEDGREVIDLQAEKAARERAAFDETKERRMRQHQVDEKFARSQECGHAVGRLARQMGWKDEVATRRIGAGFRFAEIVTEYNKDVIGAPSPNPRAMDMNKIGGYSTREITQDRVKRLTSDYMTLRQAIAMGTKDGSRAYRLLMLACVEENSCDNWPEKQVVDFVKALDAVAAMH